MAHGVADLLDRHAVAAHDRHGGMSFLVGVPAADACFSGHLGKAPGELVRRVGVAVLVAEDEVVVVPGGADCSAFSGVPLRVGRERDDCAFREFERALRLGRLGVAALACRAPDVDYSPIEVYVIPRQLAQLARAQAEGKSR